MWKLFECFFFYFSFLLLVCAPRLMMWRNSFPSRRSFFPCALWRVGVFSFWLCRTCVIQHPKGTFGTANETEARGPATHTCRPVVHKMNESGSNSQEADEVCRAASQTAVADANLPLGSCGAGNRRPKMRVTQASALAVSFCGTRQQSARAIFNRKIGLEDKPTSYRRGGFFSVPFYGATRSRF